MKIVCPQCQFTREVASEKIPTTSVMATCPQCQHRFKVSRSEDNSTQPAPYTDAVPPGAHIPNEESIQQHTTAHNDHSENAGSTQEAPSATPKLSEEEMRIAAEKAYTKQAQEAFILDNPWDEPEQFGYFSAFYQTAMRVMFASPRFFAGLMPQTHYARALLFYLIITVLQIIFERFWGGVISSSLAPSAAEYPDLQVLLDMLKPQTSLIFAVLIGSAISIVEIFFTAALFFVLFRLVAPNNVNFNLIIQVIAYSSAPILLAVVPALGSMVGFIWSTACLAIGCRYAMRLSWQQTMIGLIPFYFVALPLFLQLFLVKQ